MKQSAVESLEQSGIGAALVAMTTRDGSATHRYVTGPLLSSDANAARNLADAAHYLAMLYGSQPGILDLAAERTTEPVARQWLAQATDGFSRERSFLTALTVAAGPQPSTPGHAASDSAVVNQRRAIETLARSERKGCALGAAMALISDWQPIRVVLNAAAEKLEIEAPLSALPDSRAMIATADAIGNNPGVRRALVFGAEQILAQHRGLWDLLEAREAVRIW